MQRKLIIAFALCLLAAPARPGPLRLLESEDLKIVYPGPAFAYLVPHVAACSENALRFHRELYGYTPNEDITIFLDDFQDFGHGGANTVPVNIVNFGVAPFNYVYETVPGIDRMFWMANHEMAHIVTMDQATGRDDVYRRLFGGKVEPTPENPLSIFYNYLTTPRWNAPRWYHEGIAVFLETWMSGGLGRAQGGYDEMVFRSMVQDDSHFYDVVGLESEGTTVDFQVGVNSYLYGTRFMSYLARRYGPEKLIEWTARRPGSRAHFGTQFRAVYGAPLDQEWSHWIESEHEWQEANLAAIRRHPTTDHRRISDTTLGSVSRAFLDAERRKIYVAVRYPGQIAHIAALDLDDGSLERIAPVKGPALFYVTSLAYDREGRTLFFTSDNNGWRDLNAVDLETGESRLLMKDVRTGDLAFNAADRSLWGVRHLNGISTLVRIPPPYQEWDQVHSWPYGQDLYEIDVSPDGATLSGALAEVSGRQRLILMSIPDLMAGKAEVETLQDFENSSPANFVFSPDGRYLYGTSYYSGVSNVYRYDLVAKDIDALTNAETGFFRPVPVSEDSLIAFRYTGEGLVPGYIPNRKQERVSAVRFLGNAIAEEHPIVKEWHAGSPASVDPKETMRDGGSYSSMRHLRLQSFYPILEGYKDSGAAGLRFNIADGLNLSGFDLTVSYSPDDELESSERLHAALNFHHWSWEVSARYNAGDFYDLFGPTKRSRKGYSLGLSYNKTLVYDEPRIWRLKPAISFHGDLETLPYYQNVDATADKLLAGGVELEYENLRHSLGAVDQEAGARWQLVGSGNYVESELFPLLVSNLDYGWLLPLDHSSIWLRSSAGHSFNDEDEDNPFGQFFFGGFGNNYVDRAKIKRYREFYSFPGVELNEVGGQNYAKLMLEWTLPPLRFRRVGVPSLYVNWARFAFFTSGLKTDLDDSAISRELINLGFQVDFRVVLFSNLRTTFSLGYAAAWESGRDSSDEIMVSLKIL